MYVDPRGSINRRSTTIVTTSSGAENSLRNRQHCADPPQRRGCVARFTREIRGFCGCRSCCCGRVVALLLLLVVVVEEEKEKGRRWWSWRW